MPNLYDVLPPRWSRDDPIEKLAGGDEIAAALAEAINFRFEASGERHTHPKKGGCESCASLAADTVVRYFETNSRVLASDALAPSEVERISGIVRQIPYLGSGVYLRLAKQLGRDPDYPTVEDLIVDLAAIRDALVALHDHDRARDAELRRYRTWRSEVFGLAHEIVVVYDCLDPATIDEGNPDG